MQCTSIKKDHVSRLRFISPDPSRFHVWFPLTDNPVDEWHRLVRVHNLEGHNVEHSVDRIVSPDYSDVVDDARLEVQFLPRPAEVRCMVDNADPIFFIDRHLDMVAVGSGKTGNAINDWIRWITARNELLFWDEGREFDNAKVRIIL